MIPVTPISPIDHQQIRLTRTTRSTTSSNITHNRQTILQATPNLIDEPIQRILEPHKRVHIHCVGHMEYESSYYHWSISTTDEIIQARQGKSTASSTNTRVRAETTGIIEALKAYRSLLCNVSSLTLASTINTTTWWTANKTLYSKVKQKYMPSPTHMLEPERENTSTIHRLLSDMPNIRVQLIPVTKKSDTTNWHNTVINELTVQVQTATTQRNSTRSIYPDLGHTATLYISHEEVSAKYSNALRNAAQSSDPRNSFIHQLEHPQPCFQSIKLHSAKNNLATFTRLVTSQ